MHKFILTDMRTHKCYGVAALPMSLYEPCRKVQTQAFTNAEAATNLYGRHNPPPDNWCSPFGKAGPRVRVTSHRRHTDVDQSRARQDGRGRRSGRRSNPPRGCTCRSSSVRTRPSSSRSPRSRHIGRRTSRIDIFSRICEKEKSFALEYYSLL